MVNESLLRTVVVSEGLGVMAESSFSTVGPGVGAGAGVGAVASGGGVGSRVDPPFVKAHHVINPITARINRISRIIQKIGKSADFVA